MINMNNLYNTPYIPVSWGELIDKITILEIKSLKIKSVPSNKNILFELDSLVALIGKFHFPEEFFSLKINLSEINLKLWEVEDKIREKEMLKVFDNDFIDLARSVYRLNDIRTLIKKDINLLLSSEYFEEKSYFSS